MKFLFILTLSCILTFPSAQMKVIESGLFGGSHEWHDILLSLAVQTVRVIFRFLTKASAGTVFRWRCRRFTAGCGISDCCLSGCFAAL